MDKMVLLDCATNIAVIGVMVLSFPVRVWENSYLCIIFTFYRMFVILVNRLAGITPTFSPLFYPPFFRMIPIVVVVYRVLMVCHSDFCLKHGERVIRDQLFKTSLLLPFITALFSVLYRDNMRGFLICSSKEEVLRFNTWDFWQKKVRS